MVYKKSLWLLAAALILVSLFIYWPNSKMGYVLDDHYVIAQNPVVKHPTFVRIFGSGLFDHARRKTDSNLNYYRPFLSATFALDYQLWGMNPFAERIVNLVIHILNTSLVFVFLYLLFRNFDRAGIGAILFCILPIHEWSVRYLVGRGDLLLAFFTLSSLVSLIIFIRQEKKEWLWASLGLFVAALLSKEVALLNVAYIFMITFYATRQLRRTVVITAFFGIVAVGYYLLRLQTFPISASSVVDIGGLIQVAGLGVSYLLRFLMPWAAITAVPYGEMTALLWALSCLGLLIVGLRRSNVRNDGMAACVLGLFWIMAGTFQFLIIKRIIGRLGPVLSEHFLYLESVGFVLILALMIEKMSSMFLRKAIFVSFVFYFILLSTMSGRFWISEEVLLRHVQKLEGRPFTVAHEQLVMRFDDHKQVVMQLIDHAPSASSQSVWYKRLGDIYRKEGDYVKAKDALAKAVALNSSNSEAINEWAVCYLETGKIREGLNLLDRSISVDLDQSDAYRLAGIVYYRAGQFQPAVLYLKRAWANDPDQSETALHLMMAYYFLDDQASYLDMIDRVSQRSSDNSLVLGFAARELFSHGYFAETVKVISQAGDIFRGDAALVSLLDAAQRKISSLPKQ